MRSRRRTIALVTGAAAALVTALALAPVLGAQAATNVAAAACSAPVWAEGNTYTAGQQVTYNGHTYQALVTHTAYVGAGWNPAATPSLWKDLGACSGGGTTSPTASPSPSRTTSPSPSTSPSKSPSASPSKSPTTSPTGGTGGCAVKSRPSGKVLQGYWENWDGASNGVHPGLGWIPITDSRMAQHGYNVINLAFPVIRSDGTVLWENGMDAGVKVPTPAEMCQAKANGMTLLMSIGGAAAGIDLSSSAVADRFVATIVPILKANNFDGIDIDIETGLSGSGNINTLSTSQANLIRIIDGVLAQMPSNFGLTMAPETAYVTGGSVTYGSIWGSYLPIIKKYLDNGRLWWLNMQYYNGSMYGCSGDSYSAGTVQGFTVQTNCLNSGLTIQGTTIRIPYDKQVPGLPAQSGAGGGYMTPSLVSQAYNSVSGIKGVMDWSINWDGSKGWTFGDNVKSLQGR
ncbi:carbohydrate-binding protein [Dactylosporangium sp. CA-139114]|uniref:carbohydrate-binding protein n=1 Tax=Dactylosporangium sp. CA-139114 TaxID=3239931 RepID=UPI003D960B2A